MWTKTVSSTSCCTSPSSGRAIRSAARPRSRARASSSPSSKKPARKKKRLLLTRDRQRRAVGRQGEHGAAEPAADSHKQTTDQRAFFGFVRVERDVADHHADA